VPKCLTIAFRPGIIITDVVQQFTREHPELAVNAIRIEWDEQKACSTSEIRRRGLTRLIKQRARTR
jgi:hypothetical protein